MATTKTTKQDAGAKDAPAVIQDPDFMFKTGFLADVYKEKPISPQTPQILTRMPPEPNGFLHIGHSKALAINFGFARFHGGGCILRFDDTNPSGEEKKYFDSIEDIVAWLGFKPVRVTNASDNFDRLYELAEDLIRKDGAYMCHCSKAEIKAQRGEEIDNVRTNIRPPCRHRSRPIEESLTEFRAMRDGKYKPSEACLRMKQDLENPNPQMWDIIAYRVLENSHHYRTGDKWKIYPTYDFAHCLCDSIEGISHSLCTTEFELSRESYEWLCDKLEVYRPMQREYGRLNITGTILSKRKIKELVEKHHVRDWDDPRLYTLIALRRRGIPPGAILAFVNELGVTKAKTNIQMVRLEQTVRRYLETTVPRLMLVLEPLKVVIEDLPEDYEEMIDLPFSKDPAFGSHNVPFTRTVYIERSDFREQDSSDYFRLAPGKSVGLLRVPYPITATSFDKDPETGLVTCVHAKYEKPAEGQRFKKPKAYIHWVSESASKSSPIKAEVRIYHPLFKSEDPSAHPDGFLADLSSESEQIFPEAMLETGFEEVRRRAPWPREAGEQNVSNEDHPESVRFQGMRVGYFCVDRDSTPTKLVLNQITGLKDSIKKA
ncbi:putative glutaminyl-tRNA synthetase [Xylogone sp. PMI_703]|nr:putative glutaminyl-tRNA synthetase [Xylogone sp. PMI_703]